KREERIAPRIGEGGSYPMGSGDLTDGTHRPVRGDPFAGTLDEGGGQLDSPVSQSTAVARTVAISLFGEALAKGATFLSRKGRVRSASSTGPFSQGSRFYGWFRLIAVWLFPVDVWAPTRATGSRPHCSAISS